MYVQVNRPHSKVARQPFFSTCSISWHWYRMMRFVFNDPRIYQYKIVLFNRPCTLAELQCMQSSSVWRTSVVAGSRARRPRLLAVEECVYLCLLLALPRPALFLILPPRTPSCGVTATDLVSCRGAGLAARCALLVIGARACGNAWATEILRRTTRRDHTCTAHSLISRSKHFQRGA